MRRDHRLPGAQVLRAPAGWQAGTLRFWWFSPSNSGACCAQALDRGGTLAVAGIHLSNIPVLDYQKDLFQERDLRSVTANTRSDGVEFLALAGKIPLRPTTAAYPWTKADQALLDLSRNRFTGAAVLLRSA